MSELKRKQEELIRRIRATRSNAKLEAVRAALDQRAGRSFTDEEIAELERMREELVSGARKGKPWSVLHRELAAGRKA
jgi:DNA-directed RNA polymerase specialized sigma subunit